MKKPLPDLGLVILLNDPSSLSEEPFTVFLLMEFTCFETVPCIVEKISSISKKYI